MINELMKSLGPGTRIVYLAEEDDGLWWCELSLPLSRYTRSNAEASGPDPDSALAVTVEKAERYRLQDGEAVAA